MFSEDIKGLRKTIWVDVESGSSRALYFDTKAVDALIAHHIAAGQPVEDLRPSGVWTVLLYPQGYAPKMHLSAGGRNA